jgi:hypothetical protein
LPSIKPSVAKLDTQFPDLTPHAAEWPNPVNFLAFISLPKVRNLLHPNLTADLFMGPVKDLINAIRAIQEIVILAIGRSRNQPTAEAVEAYTKEYYNKTKFHVLRQLLRHSMWERIWECNRWTNVLKCSAMPSATVSRQDWQ